MNVLLTLTTYEVSNMMVSVLQMEKSRLSEVESFAQDHTVDPMC